MSERGLDATKPPYPLLARVRVSWTINAPNGYAGKIVFAPRRTAIGWEARVLRDDLPGQTAKWIPADRVSLLSAVEQLAEVL